VTVRNPGRIEGRGDRRTQLLRHIGEVDAQEPGVGPCSACATRWRLPCSS
jgi:hypothetical protein